MLLYFPKLSFQFSFRNVLLLLSGKIHPCLEVQSMPVNLFLWQIASSLPPSILLFIIFEE